MRKIDLADDTVKKLSMAIHRSGAHRRPANEPRGRSCHGRAAALAKDRKTLLDRSMPGGGRGIKYR
jgi:hypothetical protein